MYSFRKAEFEKLKKMRWFTRTNEAWNKSEINKVEKIGSVMGHIIKCNPKKYEEWETYFYENVASKEDIIGFAKTFRDFVLKDEKLAKEFKYDKLSDKSYWRMVECRLIFETWIGYLAEKEVCDLLSSRLKKDGYEISSKHLSPKEDNKYAVDFFLYNKGKLLCGLQIKPETYYKSKQSEVMKAIEINKDKNRDFVKRYGVPVEYACYRIMPSKERRLVKNGVVEDIEKIISC